MPTYTESWDVAKPAGSRDLSLGDDDIREFKRGITERLNTDHVQPSDETGVTTVGYHRQTTLIDSVSNPAAVAAAGRVFVKNIGGGVYELFYIDAAGNVTQLTQAGKIMSLGGEGWRTGDKILSSNTSTPSGWTDISATYNNYFIRISSGTPLTTGGSDTHDHGAATGSTTLTEAQMPVHGHPFRTASGAGGDGSGGFMLDVNASNHAAYTGSLGDTAGQQITSAGGGTGHTHSVASANNVPIFVQMKMYSKS